MLSLDYIVGLKVSSQTLLLKKQIHRTIMYPPHVLVDTSNEGSILTYMLWTRDCIAQVDYCTVSVSPASISHYSFSVPRGLMRIKVLNEVRINVKSGRFPRKAGNL